MTEIAFTPTILEQALLQELNHRISNEFPVRSEPRVAYRSSFPQSGGQRRVVWRYRAAAPLRRGPSGLCRFLTTVSVDAAEYLRKICISIRRSKLERAQEHHPT